MYVFDTSMKDWEQFLAVASSYPAAYSFDGIEQGLPSAERLLSERGGSHLLAVQVGAASVHCHFFMESELELDIDPKEVSSASQHDLLLEFAEAVAMALQKPIVLTPEGTPDSPLLSFEPVTSQWLIHGQPPSTR
jgi:hypothetical protein